MNPDPELKARIQKLIAEPIVVVDYDPNWPELFIQEKQHLQSLLPKTLYKRIEHFGSTAVPGLMAKPVIDILVEVTDLERVKSEIVPLLEALDYDYFWRPTHGDDGPPWYAWFIKRDPKNQTRTHHIHMVEKEFKSHWDRLHFRDYLIQHPHLAQEYAELKQTLALTPNSDRVKYTQGKTQFIKKVTQQALSEL